VQAYSNTGIVHIIAISGMHLGMVYLMLQFIFNLVPFTKNSRRQTLPIILLLWAFALLTGGSASVLRSAIMFTCIIIGKNYFKKPSSYNGLALSAFILLCINPFYLWDVGFQMSYLAVGGIIWLQRPIYNLWFTKNFLANKIWSMASVSLAAQLVTFPLSLLYFHQFPSLFLIVNILVLPLAAIALYAGVALLVLSFIPVLSKLIGLILFYSLKTMNAIVAYFNDFSFSVIDGISITWYGTLLIYVSLFLIASALTRKLKSQLFIGLTALLLFFLTNSVIMLQSMQQQKIIIYNASKYTAVDVIDKNKFLFYGDTIFKQDAVFRNFHLKPSRIESHANREVSTLENCAINNNSIFYNGTLLYVADSNSKFLPSAQKIPVDILLLTKKSPTLTQLTQNFSPAVVVCNGTNSLWKTAKYKQEAEALHLRFHSTATDGAYVYNVPTK
jgi:competence protein ComEC